MDISTEIQNLNHLNILKICNNLYWYDLVLNCLTFVEPWYKKWDYTIIVPGLSSLYDNYKQGISVVIYFKK